MGRNGRTRSPKGDRGWGGGGSWGGGGRRGSWGSWGGGGWSSQRGGRDRGGAASEQISRAVANFGRYPDKRPKGLEVDEEGAMTIKNLMDTWASKQGYSTQDVLDAVKEHMFHDGGCDLRFAIDQCGDEGPDSVVIRVLPKRSKEIKRFAPQADASKPGRGHSSAGGRGKHSPRQGVMKAAGKPRREPRGTAGKSTSEKLDMPLEAIIHDETGSQCSGGAPAAPAASGRREKRASGMPRRRQDHEDGSSDCTASPRDADDEDDVEMEKEAGGGPESFFIGDEGPPDGAEGTAQPEAPQPPRIDGPNPGVGWEVFQDDELKWYYFAGPPAWWCSQDDLTPKLYAEEDS